MSRMLDRLRDLVAHKGHATAALLTAIHGHAKASADPELLVLLDHILLANRFWLLTLLAAPFDQAYEARSSGSFDELVERYARTQTQEEAWLDAATELDLERSLVDARIPGGRCSLAQALIQVCMHAQGHRAQAAKLLRQHGGVPPPTDFIFWLENRPASHWPRGASRA